MVPACSADDSESRGFKSDPNLTFSKCCSLYVPIQATESNSQTILVREDDYCASKDHCDSDKFDRDRLNALFFVEDTWKIVAHD